MNESACEWESTYQVHENGLYDYWIIRMLKYYKNELNVPQQIVTLIYPSQFSCNNVSHAFQHECEPC